MIKALILGGLIRAPRRPAQPAKTSAPENDKPRSITFGDARWATEAEALAAARRPKPSKEEYRL